MTNPLPVRHLASAITALFLLILPAWMPAPAAERIIGLPDGDELTVEIHPANPPAAAGTVVWLPSEHGIQPAEREVVTALARSVAPAGFELWLPDYYSSLFLPPGSESLERAAAPALLAVLETLRHRHPRQPVFVVAANKAAAAALQSLRQWQQNDGPLRNIGLILLNPDVNRGTPTPGQALRYRPVVTMSNAAIHLIQAEKSPWRLSLHRLAEALGNGGSDVFVQRLAGVRDRFWFRPDADGAEEALSRRLPRIIIAAMRRLAPYMEKPRQAAPATRPDGETMISTKRERGLTLYRGAQGRRLALPDLDGRRHDLSDWHGKVVLLNFWAGWCPPCVHELPSMVALKRQLRDAPFEIVAVNLGESVDEIQAFLARHPVNFPVLRDATGETARQWRVGAYPTSFLIDRNGKIRYGLAGGHDWQSPETVRQIRSLLEQPAALQPRLPKQSAATSS